MSDDRTKVFVNGEGRRYWACDCDRCKGEGVRFGLPCMHCGGGGYKIRYEGQPDGPPRVVGAGRAGRRGGA